MPFRGAALWDRIPILPGLTGLESYPTVPRPSTECHPWGFGHVLLLAFLQRPFERLNVQKRNRGAVDLIFRGDVRTDAQGVPATRLILHLGLQRDQRIDDLGDHVAELGDIEIRLDVGDGSADVAG